MMFLPAPARKELAPLKMELAFARKESVPVEIQPAPDEKEMAPL